MPSQPQSDSSPDDHIPTANSVLEKMLADAKARLEPEDEKLKDLLEKYIFIDSDDDQGANDVIKGITEIARERASDLPGEENDDN